MNASSRNRFAVLEAIPVIGIALALPVCAWNRWLPLGPTESLGFSTGAVCVWLVTKGNLWNWPVGLANNVLFAILFWRARLFADCGLQGVYFLLGVWGWWQWLRGGANHGRLRVSRTTRGEWWALAVFVTVGTWALRHLLIAVNGAAPFWDSLTTVLCLAAQYLLCRKRLENWYLWILADVVYVPLYLGRHLPLTALLYAGFIILCFVGLRRWQRDLLKP